MLISREEEEKALCISLEHFFFLQHLLAASALNTVFKCFNVG